MHTFGVTKATLAIGGLKGRCLRMVDTQDWPGYAAMLTEDFTLDLGQAPEVPVIHGRDEAIRHIRASVAGAVTVHHAHNPEFKVADDSVQVIWAMDNRVVRGRDQPSFSFYCYHHDHWVKRDGMWLLRSLRVTPQHLDVYPPLDSEESAG